ncbi:hypothetical protein OCU04_008816 [Sclerotinia nivalis]|uniref:Uncharacterized protein n=1 Tax=Sclerotinia nivalis TaxID=352851 RepID=A0A9X0DIQ5_9HELO|nr:hypothetical protein OCU04_008816 [Sclerotinia nivalis]
MKEPIANTFADRLRKAERVYPLNKRHQESAAKSWTLGVFVQTGKLLVSRTEISRPFSTIPLSLRVQQFYTCYKEGFCRGATAALDSHMDAVKHYERQKFEMWKVGGEKSEDTQVKKILNKVVQSSCSGTRHAGGKG